MAKQVTLVAGDVSDDAQKWLKAHGTMVEGFGLLTITLPAKAQVRRGDRGWDYSVSFYNAEGNDEESYLEIELALDPYETSIVLKYDADRQCTCKGRGCPTCVEELATIERGDNPYAHHVQAA